MTHLLIVASKDHLKQVVQALYSHRVFHIQEYLQEEEADLSIGSPLPEATEASTKLIKIRSLESTFGVKADDLQPKQKRSMTELHATIDRDLINLEREVADLLARKSDAETALRESEQLEKELAPFAAIPIPLELYEGYSSIVVFTGTISRDVTIPFPHEKVFQSRRERNMLSLFVPVEHQEKVREILEQQGFSSLPVPQGKGLPSERLEMTIREKEALRQKIAEIERRLEELKEQQKEFIAACEELLTAQVEQAEAPLRFAVTGQAFLAEGWVPSEEVERLKGGLSLITGGNALVQELAEDHHHLPPVEYENPKFAEPTQLLIDTYSRPRYDELDPTLFVSIIFPIFFGIILGDVGYGAILLAISLLLHRFLAGREARYLLGVMRNASISSIFFGFLFSEFLGFEIAFGDFVLHPILFARHLNIGSGHGEGGGPDITGLLIFAIWIGILQITLGRALNSVNHYRHHGFKGAIPQWGWIAMMWGILLLIWSMVPIPMMPDFTGLSSIVMGFSITVLAGIALLLFGVVSVASESALELIEIPTIISHTMSYARLVAVGLSSVAIAMVVNFVAIGMLIEPNLESISVMGILMILMGIVVFIGGHLGNTALGMVGGGLQSLRLQYVEFFTKFYKGGGVKYNPFGMRKKFTED